MITPRSKPPKSHAERVRWMAMHLINDGIRSPHMEFHALTPDGIADRCLTTAETVITAFEGECCRRLERLAKANQRADTPPTTEAIGACSPVLAAIRVVPFPDGLPGSHTDTPVRDVRTDTP